MLKKEELRIIFMGTPDFGLPCLEMLKNENFNLIAVITQPDRKAGRGHKLKEPPVKIWAQDNGIPVYQFEKLKDSGVKLLKELNPDLCITAAFGQILTQKILDIPRFGVFNVHASLLPKFRGSAPIQWAIINGEKTTGITIMKTALKLDSGDIIEQDKIDIGDDCTAGELYCELSVLGANTLKKSLEKLLCEKIVYKKQNDEDASYFPMFKNDFGCIDFNNRCKQVDDFIRGTYPYPGCYIVYQDTKIKIIKSRFEIAKHRYTPGEIVFADRKRGFKVAVTDGFIEIVKLQYPGKKAVDAKDFFLGNVIETGTILGDN